MSPVAYDAHKTVVIGSSGTSLAISKEELHAS